LLEEKFRECKYANFELYDEDGNELNEKMEEKLDEIFYEFLENTSYEIYAQKIFKSIRLNACTIMYKCLTPRVLSKIVRIIEKETL
jgi:hypothetical protein